MKRVFSAQYRQISFPHCFFWKFEEGQAEGMKARKGLGTRHREVTFGVRYLHWYDMCRPFCLMIEEKIKHLRMNRLSLV